MCRHFIIYQGQKKNKMKINKKTLKNIKIILKFKNKKYFENTTETKKLKIKKHKVVNINQRNINK